MKISLTTAAARCFENRNEVRVGSSCLACFKVSAASSPGGRRARGQPVFSWSVQWIWAQFLLVAAGLFLLAHLALPDADGLTVVQGTVEQVRQVSRKNVGSFHELQVRSADGRIDPVLVGRNSATLASMQALVGRTITARVSGAEVVELGASGEIGRAHV